jgi:2-keto-4-pentenoate hydratase
MGDPRAALAWLANELPAIGAPLEAGQVVATGTCVKPVPVAPGDDVSCDFGVLGRVSMRAAPLSDRPETAGPHAEGNPS